MGLVPGAPRRLVEDDVYKGQFTPISATILDNTRRVTWFLGNFLSDLLNAEKGDVS